MSLYRSRFRNATLNIVSLILLQVLTAVSGLILPRLIISAYGSETNGLISSIAQFLSYISLLEGGIGGVVTAALYKPLNDNDMLSVSGIMKEAGRFYRKIGTVFLFYIALLCIFYPLIIHTELDRKYVISLILVISISTLLEYFFALQYVSLLTADQRARIIYSISSVTVVLNFAVTWLLIHLNANIVMLKLGSCFVFALKPLFYLFYVKKKYKLILKCCLVHDTLKQKWNGFAHHIAYFIHSSADIAVITLFMGVKYVSVYSVYFAIVSGIEKIVLSISKGSSAGIGNLIAQNKKADTERVMDLYEFIQVSVSTVVYTITSLLLIPFIRIYLAGVTDIDYVQPVFGYLLLAAEFFYSVRCVYSTVTSSAGHFKQTQPGVFGEAILNVILSLALVRPFGLGGVAIGTLSAMIFRTLYEVIYLKGNIMYRSVLKFVKIIVVNAVVSFVSIIVCSLLINYFFDTWIDWFINAIYTSLITMSIAIILYLIFYRTHVKQLIDQMKNLFKKNKNILE